MPVKGSGKFAKHPAVKVAQDACWKYRGILHKNGIDWNEARWDILPDLLTADLKFDGRGSRGGFLWLCAQRLVFRLAVKWRDRRRWAVEHQLRSEHLVAVWDESLADIETDDFAEFALTSLHARDRMTVRRQFSGDSFSALGSELGVTRERCRQLQVRGLKHATLAARKEAVRVGSYLNDLGHEHAHPGSSPVATCRS
jgi:hypothetical protein